MHKNAEINRFRQRFGEDLSALLDGLLLRTTEYS